MERGADVWSGLAAPYDGSLPLVMAVEKGNTQAAR